jgi:plasmid maintenance system antidote protein VapI
MATDIKTRVRVTLAKRQRSQGWLADAVGISGAHLSRILAHKRAASSGVAERLEAVTGIAARHFSRAA